MYLALLSASGVATARIASACHTHFDNRASALLSWLPCPGHRCTTATRCSTRPKQLAVEGGVKAVTIRAVSERAGISNGAIYHAFGSRGGLVGRAWVRAARRFLALQQEAVDAEDDPVRAVIAAADAPAVFSEQYPSSARLCARASPATN